jgi:hypothetical protein
MARPKKPIDPKLVERLARLNCTMLEIASVAQCSVDTLERRFADAIQRGREHGKASLRRAQWKAAKGGNAALLIWLGKQLLGQKDALDLTNSDGSLADRWGAALGRMNQEASAPAGSPQKNSTH